MRITIFSAVAGAAVCLAALTGCGDPADDERRSDIATLRTGQPAPAGSPSTAAQERPVMRPDEGLEAYDQYMAVWEKCMRNEGVAVSAKSHKIDKPLDAKGEAAGAKCAHLIPENWMENQARTNPEYVDRLREMAACLKGRGHQVTVGGDPVALMYGDNTSANKAYDDEQDCQQQAFREELKKADAGK
jgi:hypothetical protein